MPRRKIEQKRGQEVSILSRVFKESYQEGDIAKNLKKKVSDCTSWREGFFRQREVPSAVALNGFLSVLKEPV